MESTNVQGKNTQINILGALNKVLENSEGITVGYEIISYELVDITPGRLMKVDEDIEDNNNTVYKTIKVLRCISYSDFWAMCRTKNLHLVNAITYQNREIQEIYKEEHVQKNIKRFLKKNKLIKGKYRGSSKILKELYDLMESDIEGLRITQNERRLNI